MLLSVLNWVGNNQHGYHFMLYDSMWYVMFNIQDHMFNQNMENHPGKQYNHKN
jgi:hypothetical protein